MQNNLVYKEICLLISNEKLNNKSLINKIPLKYLNYRYLDNDYQIINELSFLRYRYINDEKYMYDTLLVDRIDSNYWIPQILIYIYPIIDNAYIQCQISDKQIILDYFILDNGFKVIANSLINIDDSNLILKIKYFKFKLQVLSCELELNNYLDISYNIYKQSELIDSLLDKFNEFINSKLLIIKLGRDSK